jgi:pimeloyl-ACP methyl ester carboxylesterase
MSDLHLEICGSGEPALFVHGSGSWGTDTFGRQRALADEFQVILIDRHGYGQSPAGPVVGWQADASAVAGLLTRLGRAHLVGHSSGGTVALLAAAQAPHAVRSLTVVEPAVWGIADPESSPPRFAAADRDAWTRGPGMSAPQFLAALTALYTGDSEAAEFTAATTAGFTAADWAAADTWRHEAWPGDAPIDLQALATAGFPAIVAIGQYDPAAQPAAAQYATTGHLHALQAERRALARRINARLEVLARSMHNPMAEETDTFNTLLRQTWRAAPSQPTNPNQT